MSKSLLYALSNAAWHRAPGLFLLVLLFAGCGGIQAIPPGRAPTATARASHQGTLLSVIYPLASTHVSAGEDLRIVLYLVDHDDQPMAGASVQAELWTPSGELFLRAQCVDQGGGRYLSEYVSLPTRGASGMWRVVGMATGNDTQQDGVECPFEVDPSVSEMYQDRYGFWIDHPHVFGLGTGFYSLSESGGLHFEDRLNDDGSGYVVLDNYRYGPASVTFAALEIHWRRSEFPADEAAATAFAQGLTETGLSHQAPDTALTGLTSTRVTFQGRPAWQVLGRAKEYYVSEAAAEYPVEWLIFRCPGSEWLWSLILSTDREIYINHLRALQETFECPPGIPD